VTRYSVDLDELLSFTNRLAVFNRQAEEIAQSVDRQIAQLHDTWAGIGAEAEKDYHETWVRLAKEMREAVAFLRENAERAHRNFTEVGEFNKAMWP
jgi:uncharacterized protein YukE